MWHSIQTARETLVYMGRCDVVVQHTSKRISSQDLFSSHSLFKPRNNYTEIDGNL